MPTGDHRRMASSLELTATDSAIGPTERRREREENAAPLGRHHLSRREALFALAPCRRAVSMTRLLVECGDLAGDVCSPRGCAASVECEEGGLRSFVVSRGQARSPEGHEGLTLGLVSATTDGHRFLEVREGFRGFAGVDQDPTELDESGGQVVIRLGIRLLTPERHDATHPFARAVQPTPSPLQYGSPEQGVCDQRVAGPTLPDALFED